MEEQFLCNSPEDLEALVDKYLTDEDQYIQRHQEEALEVDTGLAKVCGMGKFGFGLAAVAAPTLEGFKQLVQNDLVSGVLSKIPPETAARIAEFAAKVDINGLTWAVTAYMGFLTVFCALGEKRLNKKLAPFKGIKANEQEQEQLAL